jgi:hypothetical protein
LDTFGLIDAALALMGIFLVSYLQDLFRLPLQGNKNGSGSALDFVIFRVHSLRLSGAVTGDDSPNLSDLRGGELMVNKT